MTKTSTKRTKTTKNTAETPEKPPETGPVGVAVLDSTETVLDSTETVLDSTETPEIIAQPAPKAGDAIDIGNGETTTITQEDVDRAAEVSAAVEEVFSEPPPLPDPITEVVPALSTVLTVDVPHIAGVEGYCTRRVDLKVSASIAKKLKGICQGLEQQEAQLQNGRYVTSPRHAIEWLLENLEQS